MRTIVIAAGLVLASACSQEAPPPANAPEAGIEAPAALAQEQTLDDPASTDDAALLRQQAEEAPPADLLTLAQGAVLVSASVDPVKALALTDGDDTSNWSAGTRRTPPPYTFVFELRSPAALTQVGIDGSGERPGGVAGGSAKAVRVEASLEGPDTGWREIATLEAGPDGATLADVAAGPKARWLKFTVLGNQSGADWVYLDEAIAYGDQDPVDDADRFTGVYQTGRVDLLELKQDGASLTGCYVENSGRSTGKLSGSVDNGVALVTWTSEADITGPATLVITSGGELDGVRYRQRSRSAWGGPPAPEGTTTPCSTETAGNPISDSLQATGEARIYGILFNHDSDVPRSISNPALRQLKEALEQNPEMNVDIEGHTDADGADAYNLDLSARRAAAVVTWLTDEGIAAARLQPVGKGEAEPVASNDTADGKALNRRVEVSVR